MRGLPSVAPLGNKQESICIFTLEFVESELVGGGVERTSACFVDPAHIPLLP